MKNNLINFLIVSFLLTGCSQPGSNHGSENANGTVTLPNNSKGWLYTSENKIYISDGDKATADKVFAGKGANIFDTRNCNAWAYNTPNVAGIKKNIDQIVDVWGANFLRICLESYDSQYDSNGGARVHWKSFEYDNDYLNDIVEIVEYAGTKKDVYVLVSLWVEPTVDGDDGWPSAETAERWRILVRNLGQYKHVMFGICNEPMKGNGSYDSDVWGRMNDVVNAIRDEEVKGGFTQHIITVQGTYGWSRHLEYYVSNPITAYDGKNIAYEVHVYNRQSEFNAMVTEPAKTLPVIIGELGPATWNGNVLMDLDDCKTLMDMADEKQIPYATWSFHRNCSPNLIEDFSSYTPTEWGAVLKKQLGGLTVEPKYTGNDGASLVTATANIASSNINSITCDFSSIGGSSTQPMTNLGDGTYSASHTVPAGYTTGTYSVIMNITKIDGTTLSRSATVTVIEKALQDLEIYANGTDITTLSWNDYGTVNVDTTDFNDGSEALRFDFNYTGWYAGYGLDFTQVNMYRYESIQIAYHLSATNGVICNFNLTDSNWKKTDGYALGSNTASYQVLTIPVTSFTGADLERLIRINILVADVETGSGSLWIDSIKLIAY